MMRTVSSDAAFLLGVCFLMACTGASARTPVILSTDVGNEIDDQWAIVALLTNPTLDVLGIVSAHAPTVPDPSAHYNFGVLVDVVENRMKLAVHPPLYEGSNLLLASDTSPRPSAGLDFLVEASRGFSRDNRLTVVTIGGATDVASAILQDPSIVDRIKVVAMGFREWPAGGDEYNVANDTKAWQVILRSRVPLVIGCGQVCKETLALTPAEARDLIAAHGPIGAWLWKEYQEWYYRFVKPLRKDDFTKPWIIWDLITLAYVDGLTEQRVVPRPVLKDNLTFEHPATDETLTWITGLDTKRVWAEFVERLDFYQRTHAVGRSGDEPATERQGSAGR
jgi:inosine-uridine nucleoside N-ribohydrolase